MKNTEQNYNFKPDQKVAVLRQRVLVGTAVVRRVAYDGSVYVEDEGRATLQRYKADGMPIDPRSQYFEYIEPWSEAHQKTQDRGRLRHAVADSLEEIEYAYGDLDDKDLRRLHLALKAIEDTVLQK